MNLYGRTFEWWTTWEYQHCLYEPLGTTVDSLNLEFLSAARWVQRSAPVNLGLGPVIQVLLDFNGRYDPISSGDDRLLDVGAK